MQARTPPIWMLGRLFTGAGVGVLQVICAAYAMELLPNRIRGTVIAFSSFWWVPLPRSRPTDTTQELHRHPPCQSHGLHAQQDAPERLADCRPRALGPRRSHALLLPPPPRVAVVLRPPRRQGQGLQEHEDAVHRCGGVRPRGGVRHHAAHARPRARGGCQGHPVARHLPGHQQGEFVEYGIADSRNAPSCS